MHEVSVALAIVDELSERAASAAIEKITAVHLRVGALAAIDVRALQFAWEVATDGTAASHSQLVITHVPLAIACSACGVERTIEGGTLPVCPVCATPSNRIVRGRELEITAMEVSV
jgi:hydrogenase nickel incorporation protein HypA/HybF